MNGFAIFQKAQAKLDKNPNDTNSQFVVDLWNASKNLHEKNQKLTIDLAALTARNAELSRNADQALSKAAQGIAPRSGSAWLESLLADPSNVLTASTSAEA